MFLVCLKEMTGTKVGFQSYGKKVCRGYKFVVEPEDSVVDSDLVRLYDENDPKILRTYKPSYL